jgi:hypothetical protein
MGDLLGSLVRRSENGNNIVSLGVGRYTLALRKGKKIHSNDIVVPIKPRSPNLYLPSYSI